MKVKDLIQELSKLPQDEEIYFCFYDHHYNAEVMWDITKEEYEEGVNYCLGVINRYKNRNEG